MSDSEQEELQEENTESSEPTLDELQAELEAKQQELEDARNHIAKLNDESTKRRLKLKEEKQRAQDAEAAAEQYQNQNRQTSETIEQLQKRLARTETRAELERAVNENNGVSELLLPALENAADVSPDGTVTIAGKSPREYVAEMKDSETYAAAFRGRGQAGAGTVSSNSANGRAVTNSKPRNQMTQREKETFIKTHGIDQYSALPLESNNG